MPTILPQNTRAANAGSIPEPVRRCNVHNQSRHAAGLVYFLDEDGNTKVVRPGPEFDLVAENALGEACSASPAISGGRMFIRTEQHLYCIGAASGDSAASE